MEERFVTHSTFVIERSYEATPERVFAAFADPGKKRRWFVEGKDYEIEEFEMDFRVGGHEHARYRFKAGTPFAGAILQNKTCYQDIVPDQRIAIAYTMTFGDQPFSASLATFEFAPTANGTSLIFTEQGAYFEGADGPQRRQSGWQQLLDRLTTELNNRDENSHA